MEEKDTLTLAEWSDVQAQQSDYRTARSWDGRRLVTRPPCRG